MNKIEFIFALAAWLAYQAILLRIAMPLAYRAQQALIALAVVLWCFIDMTQIVTIDEGVGLAETGGRILQTWQLGEMRTTDLLFAALRRGAQLFALELKPPVLKALHGSFCIVLHAALVVTLARLFAFESKRSEQVGGLTLLLLLPTTIIAIKVINYDFFAMEMLLLAVFLSLLSFRAAQPLYLWVAIPLSALAAQEKLLAAPAMFALAFVAGYSVWPKFDRAPVAVAASLRVLFALFVEVFTITASGLLMAALEPQNAAQVLDVSVFRPLTLFSGTLGYFALHAAEGQYSNAPLISFFALAAILIAANAASRRVFRQGSLAAAIMRFPWRATCTASLLLFYLVAGASYAFLTMYWAPYHPVPQSTFHPSGVFNGVTPHFAATTRGGHLLFSSAAAAAMFWGGVPTAVWLALGAGLIMAPRSEARSVFGSVPFALAMGAVAMPLAWGLLQLPTGIGAKYFNVGILSLSIAAVWLLCRSSDAIRPAQRHLLHISLSALYLAELAPFLPLGFDFHPVFAATPSVPAEGVPTYGWPGWGEEVALAVKELDRRLPVGEKVSLRYFYPGGFLGDTHIAVIQGAQNAEYSDHEYFVVSRLAVVERLCTIPTGIPAEFTIGGRGQPYAWVFRGDRLKEAAFRF